MEGTRDKAWKRHRAATGHAPDGSGQTGRILYRTIVRSSRLGRTMWVEFAIALREQS
jgi:hypothetical protein